MKYLEYKPKGSISNPIDGAKNSNTDQQIEIIEVTNKEGTIKKVKILRNPLKYLKVRLEDLTEKDLYNKKKDSKDIPLLNRIEKYPDLPEDVFIPVNYNTGKLDCSEYLLVNKRCEYINIKTNRLLNFKIDKKNKYLSINTSINGIKIVFGAHIILALTFLIVTDRNTYSFVNHINHNVSDNKLSNLEFVTPSTNSNRYDGYCNSVSEDKLLEYIAYDNKENEVFRINRRNNNGFDVCKIACAIKNNNGIFGKYTWKKSRLSKKEITLSKIGYSGNPSDYTWYSHWKYPDMFVCREGFVIYKGKILCSETRYGYIIANIGRYKSVGVNRIIAEFLLGRNLTKDEVVDHINTNSLDNSFENLRITDNVGNMNNTLTRSKFTERLILTDLFGDFVKCDFPREIIEFVGKKKNSGTKIIISNIIIQDKYICIRIGDKDDLFSKMEKIIYVFKNDELIDALPYNKYLSILKDRLPYKKSEIQYYVTNKFPMTIENDIYTFKYGKDVVDEVIKLGHGNAYKYVPEEIKQDPLTIINYDKYEHLITPINEVLNYRKNPNQKSVKEFDLFGNCLKSYESISSTQISNSQLLKVLTEKRLILHNKLWCYSGEEDKIIGNLNYIFYKVDKDGNLVEASVKSIRPFFNTENKKDLDNGTKKKYQEAKKYLNTGMLAPDGFYYQQGIDFIEPDPNNVDLIPKRPILKWTPKNKRNNRNDIS